jgi:hypothetical protein
VASDQIDRPVMTISDGNVAGLVAAGILASLAEQYIEMTGRSFGFINPLLYRMAELYPNVFNDITQGDNRCVPTHNQASAGCADKCEGFSAVEGWDPEGYESASKQRS